MAIIFLAILAWGFYEASCEVVSLTYYPFVSKADQPMTVIFTIKNPSPVEERYGYELFIDGSLKMAGTTLMPPQEIKQYTYILQSPNILLGESVRAYGRVNGLDGGGVYEARVMAPPYPQEIWSSFASFATFSSSLMGYMSSLSYYMTTMGYTMTMVGPLNVGLSLSVTLIGLLIFLELSDPAYGKVGKIILSLRRRYGWLTISLLVVFTAMIFTRVVMVIGGV